MNMCAWACTEFPLSKVRRILSISSQGIREDFLDEVDCMDSHSFRLDSCGDLGRNENASS
jgi:hypothetical protein